MDKNSLNHVLKNYKDQRLADSMCERLIKQIVEFEKNIPQNKQAAILINGYSEPILINDIGFHNPELIILHGFGKNSECVQILQHVSQVNLFLVAVERPHPEKPRRKIGF